MNFWEGVLISSIFWLFICGGALIRGLMWSYDNKLDWADGFDCGWEAAMKEKTGKEDAE